VIIKNPKILAKYRKNNRIRCDTFWGSGDVIFEYNGIPNKFATS
jgi:hypothetical protein